MLLLWLQMQKMLFLAFFADKIVASISKPPLLTKYSYGLHYCWFVVPVLIAADVVCFMKNWKGFPCITASKKVFLIYSKFCFLKNSFVVQKLCARECFMVKTSSEYEVHVLTKILLALMMMMAMMTIRLWNSIP